MVGRKERTAGEGRGKETVRGMEWEWKGLIKNHRSRKGFTHSARKEGTDATFHFDISPFSSNGNSLSFSESVFSNDKGEGNCPEVVKCYHYHDRWWVSSRLVVGCAAKRP